MTFRDRLVHAWHIFKRPQDFAYRSDLGTGNGRDPSVVYLRPGNERTIITAVYNRIALDVASVNLKHARVNQNGSFLTTIDDGLNQCLNVSANLDQTGKAFVQDLVLTMFDEGVAVAVITDADHDPNLTNIFSIKSLRVGRVRQWYPEHIDVELYNQRKGIREQVIVPKRIAAIIQNPFYSVMNNPNSTLQRLTQKLLLLDLIDKRAGSDKLDLIVQVPYQVTSELQINRSENRLRSIEQQLANSKFGIAYLDGTEKITQLNRAVENNILPQVEYLTKLLYSQLNISEEIMNGTADEKSTLNYQNRTVEPILNAISEEFSRKFLTKTARTQGQTVMYMRNPFKLVPALEIANIADRLTRNEILTSNEVRALIGYEPSDDPRADELVNKNLKQPNQGDQVGGGEMPVEDEDYDDGAPLDLPGLDSVGLDEDNQNGSEVW